MATVPTQIRIDRDIKAQATTLFASLGLDMSRAVNLFLRLKEVDSLALANAQMSLNKAYNNFFSNRKHFGKPRFKSKKP